MRPTPAEDVLWQTLRGRRLNGLKFRRQHAVDRFIVDFYCGKPKLIIEIDGEVHLNNPPRDAERTKILQALGFRLIRFTNDEVLDNPAAILARIADVCSELMSGASPSSPAGRGPGGGVP
jgi:5-methyltetrahydrofolate--homocysteine methyltransferase